MNTIDHALCYKALGDETRLTIYNMLKGGTMCGCKILEQLHCTQPTLSYHMRLLCECGLVSATKEGKWSYYSIDAQYASSLQQAIAVTEAKCSCTGGCK